MAPGRFISKKIIVDGDIAVCFLSVPDLLFLPMPGYLKKMRGMY
jgi:hypothetical protein